VEAGGAWTSVTPGSQQYWLQAFNNVLYGRWEKIDPGYGKAVLGYFGRTPLQPDPDVVRRASEQLEVPAFEGDPLAAAPDNIEPARAALSERGLPVTDRNVFLVVASMVPGKKLEVNEGIRLLTGTAKIDVPLKQRPNEEPRAPAPSVAPAAPPAPTARGPFTTRCTVEERGTTRSFTITLEPIAEASAPHQQGGPATATAAEDATPLYSSFAGSVEVVDIRVAVGDRIEQGTVVAQVEAMKATHDIRSPRAGTVRSIRVKVGDEVDSSKPLMTIG
jgi:pyruvate carboxylase subunit B